MTRRHDRRPRSDHFDGRQFFNPGQPSTDRSVADLLRWQVLGRRGDWPVQSGPVQSGPAQDVAVPPVMPPAQVDGLAVTMIGHASVLIQVAGVNVLVDPVWSERVSPVRFAGPRRADAPGIAFDDLPPIHAVLVTHNHYDHLDADTLRRLASIHRPRFVAPLGNDTVIARATGSRVNVGEVNVGDWGDRFVLGPGVDATLHPAHHWSARQPGDRRKALWCGFVLRTPAGPVYVAGDTAYGDGTIFRQVQDRFGPPVVAILPIGAYEPRWFMRNQHVNPDEAVRIMLDCGAIQALGVHWGTFQLTDEARSAPPAALLEACRTHGVDPARFLALRPGDVWNAASTA